MHLLYISLTVFLIIFMGAMSGIVLRCVLPDKHFNLPAEAAIKLVTGFVMTMTGIILGMLVSSAKSSYDGQKILVAQLSSQVILLDRSLAGYGAETHPMRLQLHEFAQASTNRIWPSTDSTKADLQPQDKIDLVGAELNDLTPKNSSQIYAKSHSIAILSDVRQSSWLLFVESDTNKLSMPLLVILVSWITAIFISFGLFAPPTPAVITTMLLGALAVSAAILIILEMYSPFSGFMRISSNPVREAIKQLQY